MKILFLANDDEGLYKFRKELIETLLINNDVFISLPYGYYVDVFKQMGCHFIDTQFNRKGTNPIKDIQLVNKYISIIKEIKPDIVLSYTIKPNVYGGIACQRTNTPYIANITGISSAIENGGLIGFIVKNLYRVGLKKAKKVFFQNEANKDYMIKNRLVHDNYDLIPGSGVNLNEYTLQEFPNDETIDFVYIARIMKEKGFDQYLDAAKYITKKYPNTRFHICGTYDEQEYESVIKDLNEKGVVIYHGSVKNMLDIYKIIQCTIHPSYYAEGMSNALLESLACGRVIITTSRPGCKELVEDNVNGFIVEQKNSDDLIRKVEMFLSLSNQKRKEMGLNGRKLVEEKFDRQIVIDKYLKEINE